MTTLPGALLRQATERPADVALRHKRLGRWVELTWAGYADQVACVASGLQQLGVGRGERVVLQGDNRPEWVIADLAIQAIGAVSVGVPPDAPVDELQSVMDQCGACAIVAEDEEQLDKALAVRRDSPLLRELMVINERGVRCLDDEHVSTWATLGNAAPADLAGLVGQLDPADPVIAVYSPGGELAVLDHASLVAAGSGFGAAFGATAGDSVLSCMPLSELSERLFSVAIALDAGYVVHFGERAGSIGEDLREVQPTLLHGVAPLWEAMYDRVTTRMAAATRLKRTVLGACVRRGSLLASARMAGSLSVAQRTQSLVCSALAFGALREKLGLSRVRVAVSSGTPLSDAARDGLQAMGVAIVEVQALDAGGLLGAEPVA